MAIKRWNANTSTWELVGSPGTATPAAIGAPSLSGTNVFTGQNGFGLAPVGANRVTIGGTSFTLDLHRYTSGGSVPGIELKKSLSDTVGSHVAVTSSSPIGRITAMGSDGTNFVSSSQISFDADGTVSTGIVPGKIIMYTNNSSGTGIERMRIDSSGKVGIGMAPNSGAYLLQVAGRIRVGSGNGDPEVAWTNRNNMNLGWTLSVRDDVGGANNDLKFLRLDDANNYAGIPLQITKADGNVLIGTSTNDQRLTISNGGGSGNTRIAMFSDTNHRFYIYNNSLGGAQQAGIGQGGYMEQNSGGTYSGVKTYASFPSYQMIIRNEGTAYEGFHFMRQNSGSTLTDGTIATMARIESNGYMLIGYTSSNGAYRLQVNSQIFATSSSIATSDGRYKENVLPITSGLDIIDSLNPVSFDWKEHPVHNFVPGKTVGFIAQEVKEALKDYEWVDNIIKTNYNEELDEEFLGIAEANIIPLLVAAVKELRSELNTLKSSML